MSIDLGTALHDVVDGARPEGPPPVDVARVRSRARRRRAVHLGARGAVGVGAAGAVALAAASLASTRDDRVVLPTDPDAAPGECGSDVTAVRGAPDPTLGLAPSSWSSPGSAFEGWPMPRPGDLGTYVGREVYVQAVSALPEDGAGAHATELSSAQDTLAVLEQGYAELVAAREAGEDVTQDELDERARIIAGFRATVDAALARGEVPPPTPEVARLRVLVTHDDRVVATTVLPAAGTSDAAARWARATSGLLTEEVRLDLVTCAVDGADDGGEPLPSGTYDLFVVRDREPLTGAAGPWTLTVPPHASVVPGLPDDFPVDAVPMPPGHLLSVDGDAAGGWTVEAEVTGVDRLVVANALLTGVDGAREEYLDPFGTGVEVPGWSVEVTPGEQGDATTLVYEVRPR